MTATDPRPALAAMLAEKLAPAVETLATAYAEDIDAGPPPPDDRALAERHRAGRAQLSHLRQLLAVLDWAAHRPHARTRTRRRAGMRTARRTPPLCLRLPSPEFRAWRERRRRRTGASLARSLDRARNAGPDRRKTIPEFHYGGEVYVGSQETPEFKAWLAEVERRAGPRPQGPRPSRPTGLMPRLTSGSSSAT